MSELSTRKLVAEEISWLTTLTIIVLFVVVATVEQYLAASNPTAAQEITSLLHFFAVLATFQFAIHLSRYNELFRSGLNRIWRSVGGGA